MQAIITTYRPATNTRSAKIHAKCAAMSCSIDYPHELSGEDVYRAAADVLCTKMADSGGGEHWLAPKVGGCLPSGQWVFVFTGAA